jgi:hypothetical protein
MMKKSLRKASGRKKRNRRTSGKASTRALEISSTDALHLMWLQERTVSLQGIIFSAEPDTDAICLADTSSTYLVIPRREIIAITSLGQWLSEVRVLADVEPRRVEVKFPKEQPFRVDEENVPPPLSFRALDDPTEGTATDQANLKAGVTIEGAAKVFKHECAGGGEYQNNCAHFLCSAFMKAGFTDFDKKHACVNARCSTTSDDQIKECAFNSPYKYRVIRAEEMRCWFKSKDTSGPKDKVEKNTGSWAVHQKRLSDGQGHVTILDSNSWKFYGTGWYSAAQGWRQEYYHW